MVTNQPLGAYGHRITGLVYDALNAVIWLPGGSRRLRQEFVAALGPAPGATVLELGCGTGQVTEFLVVSGASVTAVDRAEGKSWPLVGVERHAFYAKAKTAYCVIATGERRFYGCFLFTKGVIPPDEEH